MKIFLRNSLKDELNPQEMFNITQAGMKMYKEYFGQAYPFDKYD